MRIVPFLSLTLTATFASYSRAVQVPDSSTRPRVTIRVVTPPPPPADTLLTKLMPPGAPLLRELAKKSRRVSSETLYVYSDIGRESWFYVGEPLDTTFDGLFQPFYPELAFPHAEPELFATVRFVLDPQHVAYLLRVPGMYEPSQVDLWIYDAGARRFGLPIRVAESWGDAGCGYNLEGLLLNADGRHLPKLILHQGTGCTDMETGRTLSEADSLWVRMWTAGGFSVPVATSDSLLSKLLDKQRSRVAR